VDFPEDDTNVKCFMKDEYYPEYKHGRGIFSRQDEFKVRWGPLVSAVEAKLFKTEGFVKYVPVKDRPDYIEEHLFPGPVAATDFSSMEASFTPKVMELSKVLFKHMFKFLGELPHKLYGRLSEMNKCIFKWFTLFIEATRMSGEMDTSCSNGFATKMLIEFSAFKLKLGEIKESVEGDDSLFNTITGKFPTTEFFCPTGIYH